MKKKHLLLFSLIFSAPKHVSEATVGQSLLEELEQLDRFKTLTDAQHQLLLSAGQIYRRRCRGEQYRSAILHGATQLISCVGNDGKTQKGRTRVDDERAGDKRAGCGHSGGAGDR
ncbi:TPA: hypothetical protein MAK72_003910 [Klebsiella pneumoniae]|nr:hypothetical protein [Klebsiella aerogenes]HBS5772358.1 hypothetical protein [Klebsiella pneumoniae]